MVNYPLINLNHMSSASVRAMAAKRRKKKKQSQDRCLNHVDDHDHECVDDHDHERIDDHELVGGMDRMTVTGVEAGKFFNHCKLDTLMICAINEMNQSDYWNEAKRSLFKSFKNRLPNIHSIVIYGIGSISKSTISRYQLAFIILIKEWLMDSHEHCYIFDPIMSEDEIDFLRRRYKFEWIQENEQCRRQVHSTDELRSTDEILSTDEDGNSPVISDTINDVINDDSSAISDAINSVINDDSSLIASQEELKTTESNVDPCKEVFCDDMETKISSLGTVLRNKNIDTKKKTLFYMPHLDKSLYNNLLWKNWNLEAMNHLILIGNSFREIIERTPSRILSKEYVYIYNSIQLGIINETSFNNNFSFTDVFNDISLMTFCTDDLIGKCHQNIDTEIIVDVAKDDQKDKKQDGIKFDYITISPNTNENISLPNEILRENRVKLFNELYSEHEPSYSSDTDDVL